MTNLSQSLAKKYLIWIIEDNAMYAKMLSEHLQTSLIADALMETVDVITFPYAEICENRLNLDPARPDFIIVDYFLDSKYKNTKDGAAFVRKIKKDYPEIKLIMLSSQNDVQLAVDLSDEGICDYIVKGKESYKRVGDIIASNLKTENHNGM